MKEAGMVGREEAQWYYPKPRCESNGQNFVSVRIQDFYPALVILAYGILLSIIILVAEVLHNKYHSAPLETRRESCTRKKRNGRDLQIHWVWRKKVSTIFSHSLIKVLFWPLFCNAVTAHHRRILLVLTSNSNLMLIMFPSPHFFFPLSFHCLNWVVLDVVCRSGFSILVSIKAPHIIL